MPCASSTSACTSTSIGRLPSRATMTALPLTGCACRDRKIADGFLHLPQPLLGHREHADLVGRAEAILDRAHHAEAAAGLALEIQHGVDHVLEDARAGDHAFLRHVPDDQHRHAGSTWRSARARAADSRTCAADPGDDSTLGREHRLDRVDDEHARAGCCARAR